MEQHHPRQVLRPLERVELVPVPGEADARRRGVVEELLARLPHGRRVELLARADVAPDGLVPAPAVLLVRGPALHQELAAVVEDQHVDRAHGEARGLGRAPRLRADHAAFRVVDVEELLRGLGCHASILAPGPPCPGSRPRVGPAIIMLAGACPSSSSTSDWSSRPRTWRTTAFSPSAATCSPERLVLAYSRGIFPWYEDGLPILWHSPDPRMVLEAEELRVSTQPPQDDAQAAVPAHPRHRFPRRHRGLRGRARARARTAPGSRPRWATPTSGCSGSGSRTRPRPGAATSSWAACTACRWAAVFFGESMFARAPDASKIAFVTLVAELRRRGIDAHRLPGLHRPPRPIRCRGVAPRALPARARQVPAAADLARPLAIRRRRGCLRRTRGHRPLAPHRLGQGPEERVGHRAVPAIVRVDVIGEQLRKIR